MVLCSDCGLENPPGWHVCIHAKKGSFSIFKKLIGGVIADIIIIPAHYGLDGVPDVHELHIELDSGVKICIDIAGNGELTNWAELNIEVKEAGE